MNGTRSFALVLLLAAGLLGFFAVRTPRDRVYETSECGPTRVRTALFACAIACLVMAIVLFRLETD